MTFLSKYCYSAAEAEARGTLAAGTGKMLIKGINRTSLIIQDSTSTGGLGKRVFGQVLTCARDIARELVHPDPAAVC